MTEYTNSDYEDLLARLEIDGVRSIPGNLLKGPEAASVGQSLMMEATGTTNVTDAMAVALGRPRKSATPTTVVKAAMPDPMVQRVRQLARRQKVSTAQVLRVATAEYLVRMAA